MDITSIGIASELTPFLVGLVLWETIWKGVALWRAGRRNEIAWFVLMFILNTAGILPIVYLIITRKNKIKQKSNIKKKKK